MQKNHKHFKSMFPLIIENRKRKRVRRRKRVKEWTEKSGTGIQNYHAIKYIQIYIETVYTRTPQKDFKRTILNIIPQNDWAAVNRAYEFININRFLYMFMAIQQLIRSLIFSTYPNSVCWAIIIINKNKKGKTWYLLFTFRVGGFIFILLWLLI